MTWENNGETGQFILLFKLFSYSGVIQGVIVDASHYIFVNVQLCHLLFAFCELRKSVQPTLF